MAPEIERGQSMTAQQTTQYESKEATNSIQIDVADRINRRWDEADYEIENVDEWDSMGRGMFKVGDFEPSKLRYNGRFESFQWAVNDEQFDRRLFRVKYDELGVACIPDGDGEFDEASAMIRFNADEAKELAAAIWQAAEEYELRREQR